MDKWHKMVREQYAQQSIFYDGLPLDVAERARIAMELVLGLSEESHEYLSATEYKSLLPQQSEASDKRSKRLVQIVDMLKYVLSLAHLDGFDSDQLYNAFEGKTGLVYARRDVVMDATKVVSLDIDGVICDLVGGGFDHDADAAIKASFFDDGRTLACAPYAGARDAMDALKAAGWGIILVTTRKRHRHPTLEADTYTWLARHNIPFDRVIFAADKTDAILATRLPVKWHVEDSAKHALDVASGGIDVLYVGSAPLQHENIRRCKGIADAAHTILGH